MSNLTKSMFYFKDGDPKINEFLSLLLKNELYDKSLADSRLKKIYSGKKTIADVSGIIAFDGDLPIAIVLCERKEMISSCDIDNLSPKSNTPKISLSGHLSFFVKEEYREKKLASEMFNDLEYYLMLDLKEDAGEKYEGEIYNVYLASGKAVDIINKYSPYSYVLNTKNDPDEEIPALCDYLININNDKNYIDNSFLRKKSLSEFIKEESLKPKTSIM